MLRNKTKTFFVKNVKSAELITETFIQFSENRTIAEKYKSMTNKRPVQIELKKID